MLSILLLQGTVLIAAEIGAELEKQYQSGKYVYNDRCYYCHSYSGDAQTLAARYVSPKPVDFTAAPAHLTTERMQQSISNGRPGTAMPAFNNTLTMDEINDVIYFIQRGFMDGREAKTGYHTEANGWKDHRKKYASAFPFVLGTLSINAADSELTESQRAGRDIFFNGCISCHDAFSADEDTIWQPRAVSFPRSHSPFKEPDAITEATVYKKHGQPDMELAAQHQEGHRLFQENCAFCHAEDRTGKNWIGNFLEPHPRDLTDMEFLKSQTVESLSLTIANGVTNTSMPRWDSVLTKSQIRDIACYLLIPVTNTPNCTE